MKFSNEVLSIPKNVKMTIGKFGKGSALYLRGCQVYGERFQNYDLIVVDKIADKFAKKIKPGDKVIISGNDFHFTRDGELNVKYVVTRFKEFVEELEESIIGE